MDRKFKYKAFISYSHEDEKWATWLHRGLERYRVPKHIVGSAGLDSDRMTPIFRDREELGSASSLTNAISEALADSEYLIVVCSPTAAKSHWVNTEIERYIALGGAERILCLIVDGEPPACFPQSLQRHEPLAADARGHADGRNEAKLKIASGLLGIGLGELRQRDVQRHQRRLLAISAASFAALLVMGFLTTFALLARQEAEREAATSEQVIEFLVDSFQVSDPSEARGNSITAREVLDKGAERIEKDLNNQPDIQATLMETIGTVYTSLGLYDQAASLLQSALNKRRDLYGEKHLEVARTYNQLGDVLNLQAEYEQANEMLRNALAIRRDLLGDEHPDVAESLAGIAEVLTQEGEFEEAEPLLRQSLEIRRANFGDENFEVAQNIERLGLNRFDQGDLDAAEPLLRQAIAMQRQLAGDQPHPDLAEGLNNLGFLLYEKGELRETEALFRQALEMNRQMLDPTHSHIAFNLNNLAIVLHDKGDYDTAESLYREVLDIKKQTFGDEHPDIAQTMTNIAFLMYDKGEHNNAIALEIESIEMYRQFFPGGHPLLARELANLGGWLTREGQLEEAEPMLIESLEMRRGMLSVKHPELAGGMTALAYLYLKSGRADEASEMANDARLMFVDLLPVGHWRTAWSAIVEGASLTALGNFDAAELLLLQSYETLQENRRGGSRSRYIDETREFLIDLYTAWGRPSEAARYSTEAGPSSL